MMAKTSVSFKTDLSGPRRRERKRRRRRGRTIYCERACDAGRVGDVHLDLAVLCQTPFFKCLYKEQVRKSSKLHPIEA